MTLTILTSRQDFLRVKKGVSWGTKGFLLQAIKREKSIPAIKGPRFGITVSNHTVRRLINDRRGPVLGGREPQKQRRGPVSVQRNRMRRRLREALRLTAHRFAKHNYDYVIIGKPALFTLSFHFILKDLEKSFQKVHRRIISSD